MRFDVCINTMAVAVGIPGYRCIGWIHRSGRCLCDCDCRHSVHLPAHSQGGRQLQWILARMMNPCKKWKGTCDGKTTCPLPTTHDISLYFIIIIYAFTSISSQINAHTRTHTHSCEYTLYTFQIIHTYIQCIGYVYTLCNGTYNHVSMVHAHTVYVLYIQATILY